MIPAIQFEDVHKTFRTPQGETQAVRHITLDIHAGEVVTVIGPSGCGKSTLLNMTAGLFQPTAGRVLYQGRPVTTLNTRTGYMTQKDHLLPWRNVFSNIAVPLEIARHTRAAIATRVGELIHLVGLQGFEHAYPAQLSGGMRKRTALARLLAQDPETLLLDEPFAALDPLLRVAMQAELLRLCHTLGKTVLFVTHDLDEAIALANRCVVFTPHPGTIRTIIDIPLPPNRDVTRLRTNPAYQTLTANLWDLIARFPLLPPGESRNDGPSSRQHHPS